MKKKMLEQTVIRALSALAQPSRLQVFRRLVVAGPGGETPGSLGLALGLPAATLSFHLKELLHAGLIGQERCGRHLIYRVEIQQMNTVLSYLTENCCQGQGCLPISPSKANQAKVNRNKPNQTVCAPQTPKPTKISRRSAA